MNKLTRVDYSQLGYWRGKTAIKKVSKAARVERNKQLGLYTSNHQTYS